MMMSREPIEAKFKKGDSVLLQLGIDAKYAPEGLIRWNECIFQVEDVVPMATQAKGILYTYRLKCCKSVQGVPYTIVEEWLTKTR